MKETKWKKKKKKNFSLFTQFNFDLYPYLEGDF